jgi:uridine kinase
MARWAPLKKDQLEALAKEILHNYGRGRAIVAIDGPTGGGTRQFADDLAATVHTLGHEAFRASIEDFHTPRSFRERNGRFSPSALYEDGYDYSVLQRVLLDPFRATSGTGFVLAAFDANRDAPFQSRWTTATPDALLIIDGLFLNRRQLAGFWNYSVWLESSREAADAAVAEGGTDALQPGADRPAAEELGEEAQRDLGADALYWAEADPRGVATAIIDNNDPEHPRRIFADSC